MNAATFNATRAQSADRKFRVLGVNVDAVQIPDVIAQMESWISERGSAHFIAVTGMHGVSEAQRDPAFKRILNGADLVVPDGMPLVWLARRQRIPLKRRVYGPELMTDFCRDTAAKGYRHFLYGGDPVVVSHLLLVLRQRFPGLAIAGVYSPPFRPLTEAEETEITNRLNDSAADVVWVALGTPRQERWMHVHREKLRAPVIVGVGAAFDFIAGAKKQAPRWMRENGLEWLYRLLQEPRRLWRRYLIYGSQFAVRVILEELGFRRPD
jgi:N-acetylglucosaminyldiphosphoundecaprenol N-acetyl-beta-D-mannosaminyltransferase